MFVTFTKTLFIHDESCSRRVKDQGHPNRMSRVFEKEEDYEYS
jgi:hypothetical protein